MVILKAILKAHLEDTMSIAWVCGILWGIYDEYGWLPEPEEKLVDFASRMERWL